MSTAIYYNPEERHSLPSLSSIMNNNQNATSNNGPAATAMSSSGSLSGSSMHSTLSHQQDNTDLFSNHGSQPSSASTTPASSFSGSSSGYFGGDNKCTCKSNANRIPRPRNAFILFRQKYHQSVLDEGSVVRTNPEVSRELGRRWRALSNEDREHWNKLAEEEKTNHAKKYPGYRYTPRRNGKGKFCDFCKQKNLRQQQIQLHNHQLLQMQQDQYYLFQQQQQQQQQQVQIPQTQQQPQQVQQQAQQQQPQQFMAQQFTNQNYQTTPQASNVNLQQPYNSMVYVPPNPIQTNFQFQYNNEYVPTQEKLSPLSQVPLPYEQHYHHQPAQSQQSGSQQQNPQFAIGFEQPRFNPLPTPVNSNLAGNYGFDYQT